MSGIQQPQPPRWSPDDDVELSGPIMRQLAKRPVHIAGLLGVCVVGLLVMSKFVGFSQHQQNHDAEAALAASTGGQTGTPWTQSSFNNNNGPPSTDKHKDDPPKDPPKSNGNLLGNKPPSFGTAYPVNFNNVGEGQATGGKPGNSENKDSALGGLLKPTELSGYQATRIKHPSTTIEQGRVLLCKQVQPLTSQIPGFITAKLAYDAWSYDGTRRLLEADSTLFGEISHGLVQGQDRMFVLWRQITAPPPSGVRITLNSPAADELGEGGLPGDVDHHTWQKIGGALLLSGIETLLTGVSSGLNALIQNQNHNNSGINNNGLGGINFYQFQGQGSSLASQLLAHTINIPDTLHRDQALPCSAFLSGDLDFNNVYGLERVR